MKKMSHDTSLILKTIAVILFIGVIVFLYVYLLNIEKEIDRLNVIDAQQQTILRALVSRGIIQVQQPLQPIQPKEEAIKKPDKKESK